MATEREGHERPRRTSGDRRRDAGRRIRATRRHETVPVDVERRNGDRRDPHPRRSDTDRRAKPRLGFRLML